MTIRLGHIALGTTQLDAMIRFYCEEFDCHIAHEFCNAEGFRYGVFLAVGEGTFLELFHVQERPAGPGALRHLAFQVADIEACARRLRAGGHHPVVKRGRTDRALQCWIVDPDGREVELHEYDSTSVQYAHLPERERSASTAGKPLV